jgi:hypothetical protein
MNAKALSCTALGDKFFDSFRELLHSPALIVCLKNFREILRYQIIETTSMIVMGKTQS